MYKRKKFLSVANNPGISKEVCFDKKEINEIMAIYSRYVIAGEWYDYAIHFCKV